MVVYSCAPSKSDKKTRIIVLLVFLLSLALMVYGVFSEGDGTIIRYFALAMLLIAALLCGRYVLTIYIYSIERDDEESPCDLVIRAVRLKKTKVVCRVRISGGTFVPANRIGKYNREGRKIRNYVPGMPDDREFWFLSSESEGGDAILFTPDKTMADILSNLCGNREDNIR